MATMYYYIVADAILNIKVCLSVPMKVGKQPKLKSVGRRSSRSKKIQ